MLLSIETIERWLKRFWKRKGAGGEEPNKKNPTKQTQTENAAPRITGYVMPPHRLSSQKCGGPKMLYVK